MPAVTCEPALSNVSINFYQIYILVRQDMTNAAEYFVPNIVKNNNFILRSPTSKFSKNFNFDKIPHTFG